MGLTNHLFKPNKSRQWPRNFIFVDTEARIRRADGETEIHTLRLGHAVYRRGNRFSGIRYQSAFDFRTVKQFWDWADGQGERDRPMYVIAHNIGYDFRILGGWKQVFDRGWKLRMFYSRGRTTIIAFGRGKRKLVLLDTGNYFDGRLEDWGDYFGMPKYDIDFYNCNDSDLSEHCRQDVAILVRLWDGWEEFIRDNDFGHFSLTRSSQSLTIFRHRFMHNNIYIHSNWEATEWERYSYYGGRVEVGFLGRVQGGPFYKLDINSMYPYIMSRTEVPVALTGKVDDVTPGELLEVMFRRFAVADVRIQTDEPIYPVRTDGPLIFPTGNFRTVLCGAELYNALVAGHVTNVDFAFLYRRAKAFADYATSMYRLRWKYRETHGDFYARMIKVLLNSMYGKWGQKRTHLKEVDNQWGYPDGSHYIYAADLNSPIRLLVMGGRCFEERRGGESFNAFPGIAAAVTAAARMYLWNLMLIAGRDRVYYCDTDSIITDRRGYENLRPYVDPRRLGALKLEYVTDRLTIEGPKQYITDRETHRKGIRSDARRVDNTTFRQIQFEGLSGAITGGRNDRVIVRRVAKRLTGEYHKGRLTESGRTRPYDLDDRYTTAALI